MAMNSAAPPDSPAPAALPPGWDGALALMLDQIGTEGFVAALRGVLELTCTFESMVVTRYPFGAPPVSLFHDLDEVQAAISVQFYASGPYLLDPLYQACRKPVAPGAYRLLDLAAPRFDRSEYFRTFYRKIRLGDEIGILIRQRADSWIVVSLARNARRPRFSAEEVAQVNTVVRTVSTAVLMNWGGATEADYAAEGTILEDRLEDFAQDILSPREAEIVRLVLLGHSTPSVAALLGIAEGTVKVHRHHAYAKLGITSQAELLALAARHFMANRA